MYLKNNKNKVFKLIICLEFKLLILKAESILLKELNANLSIKYINPYPNRYIVLKNKKY